MFPTLVCQAVMCCNCRHSSTQLLLLPNLESASTFMAAGIWRWLMFLFRVVGYLAYTPQPPLRFGNKFKPQDVTLIIPTIDTDEEAMHEAMRSWVLNQPYEIIIVTVGQEKQKELKRIADTSVAADITRVLQIDKAHKRFQLVHGTQSHRSLGVYSECKRGCSKQDVTNF